jgi:ABC-type multidrug transport system ATPase subunit/pSer/pThr/pTyr-binding forkhead associated (FHA) protein
MKLRVSVLLDGVDLERSWLPPGPYTLGRQISADLRVDDPRVSRRHAEVRFEADEWQYVDESKVGSFIGPTRVTTVAITDGLVIRLADGDSGPQLTFRLEGVEPETPPLVEDPAVEYGDPSDLIGATPSSVIRIGRALDNDLVASDVAASRYHAELRAGPGGATLVDLDSHNGTFVGGERISERLLQAGDRITIGGTMLHFDHGTLAPIVEPVSAALEALGLTVALKDRRLILDRVSFALERGKLLAVVGPTGAGKSTLLKTITGAQPPDEGDVLVAGRSLYRCYEELRPTIGYVPQDDIVHAQLTLRQALLFGAELRFPPDSTAEERDQRVNSVMAQLGLSDRADVQISKLSGGQRKRTSVALELLARPALLFLDEPTSGLDPGFERAVMQLLRDLADGGRAVVVVTHAVASLDLCDQVLFLAPGGREAYFGSPRGVLAAFGASDYPAVFRAVAEQPDSPRLAPADIGARRRDDADNETPTRPIDWTGHLGTLIRRQCAVVAADRRNLLVLAVAAFVPAILILALVGSGALDAANANSHHAARTLLGALVVTASVLGAANGVREVVKEQALYQRERALGLGRVAYLSSKFAVFGAITVVQVFLLVMVATWNSGGGSFVRFALVFVASLTAVATLGFGLLISAFVSTSEKAMALVPVVFVVCWLFSGVAIDLQSKPVMQAIAYVVPSNWGTAAAASTVDLPSLDACGDATFAQSGTGTAGEAAGAAPCDARWHRSLTIWLTDVLALGVLAVAAAVGADAALARREPLESQRRQYLAAHVWGTLRNKVAARSSSNE